MLIYPDPMDGHIKIFENKYMKKPDHAHVVLTFYNKKKSWQGSWFLESFD